MTNRHLKTHCVHGHEYTVENTIYAKKNRGYGLEVQRVCRTCHNLAHKKYRESPVYDKEKKNQYARNWREANKERVIEARLRQAYGIDSLEYNRMKLEQNNKCLICKQVPTKKLVVDHCHDKGHIRGLLCSACNMRLGWYEQNKESIREYTNDKEN